MEEEYLNDTEEDIENYMRRMVPMCENLSFSFEKNGALTFKFYKKSSFHGGVGPSNVTLSFNPKPTYDSYYYRPL